jgi:hypothetical protein
VIAAAGQRKTGRDLPLLDRRYRKKKPGHDLPFLIVAAGPPTPHPSLDPHQRCRTKTLV